MLPSKSPGTLPVSTSGKGLFTQLSRFENARRRIYHAGQEAKGMLQEVAVCYASALIQPRPKPGERSLVRSS